MAKKSGHLATKCAYKFFKGVFMESNAYRNFSMFYRHLLKHVVIWKQLDLYLLLVEFDDGDICIYDDLSQSIRSVPKDPNAMTEEECRNEFGRRLVRLMGIKCITQTELSQMTNIPQYLISKYINGKTTPSFYNVDKIAKALKCSVDELRYVFGKFDDAGNKK